ncbi:hypothetical protein V7S43_007305 [Phytophthora oleae]|uniref:Uncharacterized protein n=1 Tax=Phytophthora oleae TaxID=2107226 RepID=A0ABD3FMX3_9STRA
MRENQEAADVGPEVVTIEEPRVERTSTPAAAEGPTDRSLEVLEGYVRETAHT